MPSWFMLLMSIASIPFVIIGLILLSILFGVALWTLVASISMTVNKIKRRRKRSP